MNSLTITQTKANGIVEGPVSNQIITKLYNIGKNDDEHQTLTVGVDTTDENRPVSTVSGRIRVNSAFANQLEYLAVKFPDLEINADSTYIYFEDPEVERVLLAAGIGDGTGITASDAASANLGTIFKDNTTITSFNEFGYFTRANTYPTNEMFRGCTNLSSVDFSDTSSIANLQFCNTALTTLNIPNLQVLSGDSQFKQCTKLTEVLNLGSITSIPSSMFDSCSLLTNVVLPEQCVSIGSGAFKYNTSLQNINLQNIVTIGHEGFRGSRLSGVLNLPKLTTIAGSVFQNCDFLTGVECLGKISTITNYNLFYGAGSITYAKIPYECTTIGAGAFKECTNLTSIKQYTDSIDNWVEGEEPTTGPLSRVTSFVDECFRNCSLLTLTQQDIQNATTIGQGAFRGTLLSGPIDLSNVSSIAQDSFRYTKITSVTLGPNITSIPSGCFESCRNLSYIYGLENVTYIGSHFADDGGLFSGMDVLHFDNLTSCDGSITNWDTWNTSYPCHMYFPKLTTMPGSYSNGSVYHDGFFTARGGFGCSFVYFRDISVVKPGTFSWAYIKSFVINNTTPPSVTGIVSGNSEKQLDRIFHGSQIENIYVPDESISAYQNSDFLSSYLQNGYTKNNVQMYPQLRGMSELTHYATEADWVAAGKPVDGIIDAYM